MDNCSMKVWEKSDFATSVAEAQKHQRQFGGWIYVGHTGEAVVWFSLKYTLTSVFGHPVTKAIAPTGGIINPTEAQLAPMLG